jgi:CO/xanthine dehydrogenase Mo-binding subunit
MKAQPSASCRTAKSRSPLARPARARARQRRFPQIVADRLGCKIEDVVVTLADTAGIAMGVGAFAGATNRTTLARVITEP